MAKWLSGMDEGLPQWLNKPETQWVQWVYAIWQLLRCNPVTILVLSYLPFKLNQWWRKKAAKVVVLGVTRDYTTNPWEVVDHFENGPIRLKNIEKITTHYHENDPNQPYFFTVRHKSYYYFIHTGPLCQLLKLAQDLGENIVFVDSFRRISKSVAVGKQLSETEAYEKIFSRRYQCSRGADVVVPTTFNYVDFSSKFWVLISTLPILLQANNYVKLSTLLSLVVILLDINRGRLYRLYDRSFNALALYVKLNIFKSRSGLYDFFSIFSPRWGYTDIVKKHAYATQAGERLTISCYAKMEKPDDIKIVEWQRYMDDPKEENIFMEIDINKAHCAHKEYNEIYQVAELKRRVYVL